MPNKRDVRMPWHAGRVAVYKARKSNSSWCRRNVHHRCTMMDCQCKCHPSDGEQAPATG